MEECLRLLRGERDEQRLVGLYIATKLCSKDNLETIRQVYDAIGTCFLDRLLHTGMIKGSIRTAKDHDLYLSLSTAVLAAFCHVPEIASSTDIVSKIPLVLQVMEKESALPLLEDCFELLFLTSSASESGVTTLFESGGLKLLAVHLSAFADGSSVLEKALRLVRLIVSKISLDSIISRNLMELSTLVAAVARQFALLQNAMKFELLQLITIVLSSDQSVPLHTALRALLDHRWAAYIHSGVVDILQNRVTAEQKLQALIVAESMVSILGEGWLITQMDIPDLHTSFRPDRCLLLVLESARVEFAVLVNELAFMKYEASSPKTEMLPLKKRNLAVAFSLVERIIRLFSNISEDEGGIVSESTFVKVISGLNETVEVVLEYLKDAKDLGQKKGDDLLACVRIVGSYLAEAPLACKEKVNELLHYMLSVEGENDSRPFLSVCFLLPMLCQMTMRIEGVKVLASSEGYRSVIKCLSELVRADPGLVEDNGSIFLACDTILNILLKREDIKDKLDLSAFVPLLKTLAYWTEASSDLSVMMMASSICSLIFDLTSEEGLLRSLEIDMGTYQKLSHLIFRGLGTYRQEMCNDSKSEADLHQILAAGYSQWADRFPLVRNIVEQ